MTTPFPLVVIVLGRNIDPSLMGGFLNRNARKSQSLLVPLDMWKRQINLPPSSNHESSESADKVNTPRIAEQR